MGVTVTGVAVTTIPWSVAVAAGGSVGTGSVTVELGTAVGSRSVGLGCAVGDEMLMPPSASAKERPPTTSTTETNAYKSPVPSWRRELMLWFPCPQAWADCLPLGAE